MKWRRCQKELTMTNTPQKGGSSIAARNRTPSLNLAKLAELLAKAVPADHGGGKGQIPLLSLDGTKLRVNTRAVLGRLLLDEGFKPAFEPGEDAGFIRDMAMPGIGTTSKIGGRLLPGSEAATAKQLVQVHDAVKREIDTALAAFDLNSFAANSLEGALAKMGATLGEQMPRMPKTASVVPIHFAPQSRKLVEREKDIARVVSAMETVDGRDWLEVLLSGISRRLQNDGLDQEEIDAILAAIRKQRNQPGSQVAQLLDFLEDEALSRVRMQVGMRLMEAVAANSGKKGLKEYVERVKACFELFAGPDGESLLMDSSKAYGVSNNVDLASELRKAMFYNCLSVWAEWSVQLFERRSSPSRDQPTIREVSYRFRVNGINPQEGISAFDARLARIRNKLLQDPGPNSRVQRAVAELVFLHLVVPDSMTEPTPRDVKATALSIAHAIKDAPVATLEKLWHKVSAKSAVMDGLAEELVSVLRSKPTSLVDRANNRVDKFMVYVHKDIINWEAVSSLSSASTEVLVKPEQGPDKIAWFSHLQVSERLDLPGSIASLSVQTELQERSLTPTGDVREVPMARALSESVISVRFIPFSVDKDTRQWRATIPNPRLFDTGVGVDLEYDMRIMRLNFTKEHEKPKSEQLRSATLVAFSLLSYLVLWELVRRLKELRMTAVPAAGPLSMTMVRLQHEGKKKSQEDDAHDANTAVYSVSHALEKALSRELPVKLQGISSAPGGSENAIKWTKKGALQALMGGQPLRFSMEGSLEKVALVTYVTRPCDIHPQIADAEGHLFISRTYVAAHIAEGTELRLDRMQARLVDSNKDFKSPQLILEEVARLYKAGYTHIMLLSHHFGNRHLGRASERHAPHGTREFLDDAAQKFPNVHLYPIRRDIFPATRLRKRTAGESAFEVVSFDDHQKMYFEGSADVLRSLQPIYTFATLNVVGEEKRPQSGFCTYFYDLETRLEDFKLNESIRQNILGFGAGKPVHDSLISVLRAVHFMESEKPIGAGKLLPVLDPFDWAMPTTTAAAGEVAVMTRRGKGSVLLCLPAMLAQATKVLHKEAQ
jgi:hypothetical protein